MLVPTYYGCRRFASFSALNVPFISINCDGVDFNEVADAFEICTKLIQKFSAEVLTVKQHKKSS